MVAKKYARIENVKLCYADIAARYNCSSSSLHRWINKLGLEKAITKIIANKAKVLSPCLNPECRKKIKAQYCNSSCRYAYLHPESQKPKQKVEQVSPSKNHGRPELCKKCDDYMKDACPIDFMSNKSTHNPSKNCYRRNKNTSLETQASRRLQSYQ